MGLSRRQVYEGVQLAALQGLEMGASVAEVASVEPFSSSVALLLKRWLRKTGAQRG